MLLIVMPFRQTKKLRLDAIRKFRLAKESFGRLTKETVFIFRNALFQNTITLGPDRLTECQVIVIEVGRQNTLHCLTEPSKFQIL